MEIETHTNSAQVLDADASAFLGELHRRFEPTRRRLLKRRQNRSGLGLLESTREVRNSEWVVATPPADLAVRRVEITGPVDRKMVINALNSGADVFMADFEDANSPTWENVVEGHANLCDAVRGMISLTTPDKRYELDSDPATLMVRPRGWHLVEKHHQVDGESISASLFDLGLYCFHNARALVERGSGPYFYLPKLESHLEARLWNDVFIHVQQALDIPYGTIRATVLIETLPAAFEMDEILYELRDHSAGLNAGRWDYIFSVIKNHPDDPTAVLPDRGVVSMDVPFMAAYTDRLVATCHRRQAYAIGGMAAFIPNRNNPERTRAAFDAVRADKTREARQGFDGTWVAHPGLVPIARQAFDAVIGPEVTNQLERIPTPPDIDELLQIEVEGGRITEDGLRLNVRVGILYLTHWLQGTGAAALFDLMEDAATAEISRSQVWQWVHHRVHLEDGRLIDEALVRSVIDSELPGIREVLGTSGARLVDAIELFTDLVLAPELSEFLTTIAYDLID